MGFWNQLWLLSWKNFTLRKRQKTRLIIELFWPLVIFLILVLVRIDEPPYFTQECHFNAKALPSAGILPFVQSFVCGMTNGCKQGTTFSEMGKNVDVYQDAGLSQILREFDEIFSNRTIIEDLETLLIEMSDVERRLPLLNDLQNGVAQNIPGSGVLLDYLKDPSEVQRFLMNDIGLSPDVTQAILNSAANPLEIYSLIGPTSIQDAACNKETLQMLFSVTDQRLLDKMQKELCALTADQFAQIGREFWQNIDTNQLLDLLSQYNSGGQLNPGNLGEGGLPDLGGLGGLGGLGALGALGGLGGLSGFDPSLLQAMGMVQNAGKSAVADTSLGDLLNSPFFIERLLLQQYNFNPDAVSTLLNSTASPQELLLLMQGRDMRSTVCNTTALAPYITTNDPQKVAELSQALCNMTDQQLDDLSENLRNTLNYMGNTTNGGDLKELLEELQDIYKKIQELDSLKNLTDNIRAIFANNDTSFLFCGSEGGGFFGGGNSSMSGEDLLNRTQGVVVKGWSTNGARGVKSSLFNGDDEGDDEVKNGTWTGDNGHVVDENCAVVQMIEQIEVGGIPIGETIWRQLKPMIQGYIFYTPDTNATRRIIEKASQPLQNLEMIEDLAYRWLDFSPVLREFIYNLTDAVEETSFNDLNNRFPNVTQDPDLRRLIGFLRNISLSNETVDMGYLNATEWLQTLDTLDQLANSTIAIMSCVRFEKFRGYPSEEAMIDDAILYLENNTLWAAVVFNNFDPDPESTDIPQYIDYKIRQDSDISERTKRMHSKYWIPGPRASFKDLKYVQNGFIFIQDMIEQGIIKAALDKDDIGAGMYIQQFPYPCYIDDFFVFMLSGVMPLFMTVSWVFSVAMIIKGIVLEKERRLKEVMKVMGLSNGVHWVAWFIDSFLMMLMSCILLVICFKWGNLVIYSSSTALLFFLVSFSVSTIMLCFLISVFFSKANLSAACGAVFFFLTYVPFTMVLAWDGLMGIRAKVAVSLLNTIAFGYGSLYLALYEVQGTGIQWNNLNSTPLAGEDGLTMLQVILLMWLDAFIYGFLTWYIEAVHPGQYGMPKPWYFPFTRTYWCGSKKTNDADHIVLQQTGARANPSIDLEKEPTHLPLGVSIQDLVKIYKNGKLAVDHLSVNFYEGQITSFLGHNGAGKTTTMSILTGLFPPSFGTSYVYDKNILTDINEIRYSLGMCPQHNVLFDNLTVAEHLWFYARLKGAKESDVKKETEQMLKDLGLPHKRNERTTSLSGGMKRKLSIAMAFVAGSRTVILDEPTAGVDPYARREIWDLLSRYKKGRTIIMSTHHMDEADVLGDRIAIISQGRLRCCGSSLFLKSRFGNGYYLVLTKKPSNADRNFGPLLNNQRVQRKTQEIGQGKKLNVDLEEPELQKFGVQEGKEDIDEDVIDKAKSADAVIKDVGYCSEPNITAFIQHFVPGAQVSENLGTELSYLLPTNAARGHGFEKLFKDLEANMEKLHISNFGISDTSLEEVFLTVTEEDTVFTPANTDLYTDGGRLPRPFMGRGSLRRRDYRLSSNASLNKVEDRQGLVNNEEVDPARNDNNPDTNDTMLPSGDLGLATSSPQGNIQIEHANLHTPIKKARSPLLPFFQPVGFLPVSTVLPHRDPLEGASSHDALRGNHGNQGHSRYHSSMFPSATSLLQRFGLSVIKEDEATSPPVHHDEEEDDYVEQLNLSGKRVKGLQLIRRQFSALFFKRFHHSRRSKKGFFAQVLLPVMFVCFSMMFATLIPPVEQPRSLALVPWNDEAPRYVFYSNDDPELELANRMEESIVGDPGIGVRCMKSEPLESFQCQADQADDHFNYHYLDPELNKQYLNGNLTCDCSQGHLMCPEGAEGPAPPDMVVPTADVLQNFTSRNISDWLVKTNAEFIWKRWGGLSFGEYNNIALMTWNQTQDLLDEWKAINQSYSMPIPGSNTNLVPDEETVSELYDVLLSLATERNTKVWWDNTGFHALPTYMNVMNNALFRANLNNSQNPNLYGITVHNHPLNYTHTQLADEAMGQTSVDLAVAMFVLFALAFVPASFVVFLIDERVSKAKHLQIVSGVNPAIYWIANFTWDLVNYAVPALLTVVIFIAFQQEAFISGNSLPCVILLLLLYGWAVTPMTYPAAYIFDVPSTAYLSMACGNMLIGIVTVLTTYILDLLAQENEYLGDLNTVFKSLFLIFPPFCLGRGLMEMANNHLMSTVLSRFVDIPIPNPFNWEVVGRNLFALFLEGFIFFAFTLLLEYRFFYKPKHVETQRGSSEEQDDDVEKEKQRVLSGRATEDMVRIENLSKVYRTSRGPMTAVNRMCVGIPRGECFGLLGVNGAGKTTTFKMLTGDTSVTSGRAYVNTHSILTNMQEVNQSMGYCPQFDALDELLTGREHLQFYARLRGVPEEDISTVADWGIRKLGLRQYAERSAGTYSGGNKRKLSTAIALIGDPPVVFLDEPTTGMDPKARRSLWNCITSIVREGRSVILTSHSMEECEALCTRLAIMVNGNFKCLGSTQHLKNKFGDGYTLVIRVGGDHPKTDELMRFITQTFRHARLKERHFNMLEFDMPMAQTVLSKVFGTMEGQRQRFLIEDYSISQTTLDQVFIGFAKQQRTGDEVEDDPMLNLDPDDAEAPVCNNQIALTMDTTSASARFVNDTRPSPGAVPEHSIQFPPAAPKNINLLQDHTKNEFVNPMFSPASGTVSPTGIEGPGDLGYANPLFSNLAGRDPSLAPNPINLANNPNVATDCYLATDSADVNLATGVDRAESQQDFMPLFGVSDSSTC